MFRPSPFVATAVLASLLVASADAQATLTLNGQTSIVSEIGDPITATITGPAGQPAALLLDTDPGPTSFMGVSIPVAFSPAFVLAPLGNIPAGGSLDVQIEVPHIEGLHAQKFYLAVVAIDPGAPANLAVSGGNDVTLVARPQLAGNSLLVHPHFEHVTAFNRLSTVELAIDPRYSFVDGKTADIYVVASQTASQWDSNTALTDARGAPQTVTFPAGATSIQQNTFLLDSGTLLGPDESNSSGDTRIGVGYDIVIDFGQDGNFDAGVDMIDGYDDEEAGFYVCRNLQRGATLGQSARGPYPVSEITYSGGSFLGQNTYYPTNITSLGQLPLVVVSHGNGHNYQWYNHLGFHIASYGYVVMSHQNNTVPGSHTAATTTLTNTDYIIGAQGSINGGVLNGHIDSGNIVWIGHSRGGDGVARAYDQLFRGAYTPNNYSIGDIKLVSSIAPVDFGGWAGQAPLLGGNGNGSHPHDANFHLWVGQADADVNGCANAAQTFWYAIHERATRKRQSISLYGVGHGDFHDGGGSSVASGPGLIGRAATHNIMRGYALALISHHIHGDIPSRDYLWRQYESFRAVGSPATANVHVNMMFQDDLESGKFVIDDFQNQSFVSPLVATSGAAVSFDVQQLVEGRADDANDVFSSNANDPFNGFTMDDYNGSGHQRSNSFATVFSFNGSGDYQISYDLTTVADLPDFRDFAYLSFRAAQSSRHPFTTAAFGDLTFSVSLEDTAGNVGTINIGAYGGGIEEPYQRNSGPTCGTGSGWNSEFETIRIRLTDFLNDGSDVNLSSIAKLTFLFGPSYGSTQGRLGLDEIELTTK